MIAMRSIVSPTPPGRSLSESQLDYANQEQDHDNDDDYADDPDATISVHLNLPVMSHGGHSVVLWGIVARNAASCRQPWSEDLAAHRAGLCIASGAPLAVTRCPTRCVNALRDRFCLS
jgi:hypothetical protein